MFSDVLRIAMLMPFILQRFLKSHHIKAETLSNWFINSGIRQNSAALRLCTCWTIEAKVLKLTFSAIMTESIYQELQESLKREHEILIQVSLFYNVLDQIMIFKINHLDSLLNL